MSYENADLSISDGVPVEVYKFTGNGRTYLYTSADEAVTFAGETYQPETIERNALEVSSVSSPVTIDITLPVSTELAKDYAFLVTPVALAVEIRRFHLGTNIETENRLVWRGTVVGYSVSDYAFTVNTASKNQVAFNTGIKTVYYQTTCNHELYDERCKVSRAANTVAATVLDVSENVFIVNDDGYPDGELVAGEMVVPRTGERRLITKNEANSVTVSSAFFDIAAGEAVTLTRGCDHAFSTCKAKFANGDNFGGFPYAPSSNPLG